MHAVMNPSDLLRPATVAQTHAAARLRRLGGSTRPIRIAASALAAHKRSAFPLTPTFPLSPKPIKQMHAPAPRPTTRASARPWAAALAAMAQPAAARAHAFSTAVRIAASRRSTPPSATNPSAPVAGTNGG